MESKTPEVGPANSVLTSLPGGALSSLRTIALALKETAFQSSHHPSISLMPKYLWRACSRGRKLFGTQHHAPQEHLRVQLE